MRIPTLNSFVGVLIFFLLFCGCASATVEYDPINFQISVQNEPCATIQTVAASLNNGSLMKNTGDGIWQINASLSISNSTLYLNNTTLNELRVVGGSPYGGLISFSTNGVYKIDGIKITGWDKNTNSATRINIIRLNGGTAGNPLQLNNTIIEYTGKIYVPNLYQNVNNITLFHTSDFEVLNSHNVTLSNFDIDYCHAISSSAIWIYDSSHIKLDHADINTTFRTGVVAENVTYSEICNIRLDHAILDTNGNTLFDDVRDNVNGDSGCFGISMGQGHNNYVHDAWLNYTGWSTLCAGKENYTTFKNVTINYSGHNGIDVHPADNLLFDNVSIDNSMSNAMCFTGDIEGLWTGTLDWSENVTVKNSYIRGAGMLGGEAVRGLYFENVTTDSHVFQFLATDTGRLINCTMYEIPNERYNYSKIGGYYFGIVHFVSGQTSTVFKPANITVIDASFPTATIEDYDVGNAKWINVNTTRLSSACNNLTEYYYPNIKVVNLTGTPVQDAIITVNTSSVNGYGESQTTFRTDSTGKLYDTGNRSNWLAIPDIDYFTDPDTTYISEITATKSGITDSEAVNPDSTWYSPNPANLQGSEIVLVLDVAGEDQLDSNFSASPLSGTYPLKVQFNDTSVGTPTSWEWDFDNNGIIDSTVQNPVYNYRAKGIFSPSLTVTNTAGNDTEMKSNYITVSKPSILTIIIRDVFGWFYVGGGLIGESIYSDVSK